MKVYIVLRVDAFAVYEAFYWPEILGVYATREDAEVAKAREKERETIDWYNVCIITKTIKAHPETLSYYAVENYMKKQLKKKFTYDWNTKTWTVYV